MKKLIQLAGIFSLCLFFSNCSSNEGDSTILNGTLLVNSVNFPIGTNIAGAIHNTTTFHQGGPTADLFSNRNFTITSAASVSAATLENITITIIYPGNQSSINGTYPVDHVIVSATDTNFATTAFSNSADTFGGQPQFASGTITVTDLGSNNFKIVFNNVVLTNNTNTAVSKTITGYCQTAFYPIT